MKKSFFRVVVATVAITMAMVFITGCGESEEKQQEKARAAAQARLERLERDGIMANVAIRFASDNALGDSCGIFFDPSINFSAFGYDFTASKCDGKVMFWEGVQLNQWSGDYTIEHSENHQQCDGQLTLDINDMVKMDNGDTVTFDICRGVVLSLRSKAADDHIAKDKRAEIAGDIADILEIFTDR